MEYVPHYANWYCPRCRQYPQPPPPPAYPAYPVGYPPYSPEEERRKSSKLIIIIVIIVIIFIAIPIILSAVLYVWVNNLAETGDEFSPFPTIQVTLNDYGSEDELKIKHLQGDPLDWARYKIIITNQSNSMDIATINDLGRLDTITAGETSTIDSSIVGFADINYQKGKAYQLEIYNIRENKRVYYRSFVICE